MDSMTLGKFKALFEEQKDALLCSVSAASEDFRLETDDMADEVDLTSSEMGRAMRMRLKSREALFLKKIDQALQRIEEGSFGLCESCGEDIELRRLEARPTASHCVQCKEEQERKERIHIDGHRIKSLGPKLRLA